jgi:hypothetical protein
MAVPALPTVTSIVTQALKRAGRTNPSADQITEATDHALQEVKADIMLVAPTHPNLMATATTVTLKGLQRYIIPSDLNEYGSITLMDGPSTYRGTAQGGSTTSIILAVDQTGTADELIGKYILITSGFGVEEYREIIDYDAGTKVATVEVAWDIIPTAASTYLIITDYIQLYPNDIKTDFELIRSNSGLGTPAVATVFNQEYLLYPVPDLSTYGLLSRYWVDLSRIDETSALFVQLLREWRSTWIQGIAVKTMQRFDEDRYRNELGVYKLMLDLLASQTCRVSQTRFYDF